ncbi:hypothetical protein BT69DRAFT_1350464 [Atractiella rhizophila]|nr:hypothetical protein BT69DRAFT_1350464 [Atractiella rhizophila]
MSRMLVKTQVWFKLKAIDYSSQYHHVCSTSCSTPNQGTPLFHDASMILEAAKRCFRMHDDDEFLQMFRLDPSYRILVRYTIESPSSSSQQPPRNFDLGLFENPLALNAELAQFNNAISFLKGDEKIMVEFFQDDQILEWANSVRQEQIKRQMRKEEVQRQRLLEREQPTGIIVE